MTMTFVLNFKASLLTAPRYQSVA